MKINDDYNDNEKLTNYTCDKCNKTPNIVNIDYMENNIEFDCEEHKIHKLKIDEYLNSISNFQECQKCYNRFYANNKYCLNCKIILCDKCLYDHKKEFSEHNIIRNEDYNIKCKEHIEESYVGYCNTCKKSICNECKRTRKHINHQKYDFLEIQPSKKELDIIYKFNENIEKKMENKNVNNILESIEKEKNNKINVIINIYKTNKDICEKKWKEEFDKLLEKKKREMSHLKEQKNEELTNINKEYEEKKNDCENKLKVNIENYKNIIILNNIIVDSYQKQKDNNLYYNTNISKVIESIKKYNDDEKMVIFKEWKEKYNIIINKEKTSLNGKSNDINNNIINNIFKFKFDSLKDINLSSNSLDKLDFLYGIKLVNLEKLILYDCPINDISILSKISFNSLIELKITKGNICQIDTLDGLNCINLNLLDLSQNNIENINVLNSCNFNKSLTQLYLNNNKINDISVFNNKIFCKLKILFLNNNNIQNISPLEYVLKNSCSGLSLAENPINDISLFKEINLFFNLRNLSLTLNEIEINDKNKGIINLIKSKKNIKLLI